MPKCVICINLNEIDKAVVVTQAKKNESEKVIFLGASTGHLFIRPLNAIFVGFMSHNQWDDTHFIHLPRKAKNFLFS